MDNELKVPEFASEADEAQWWPEQEERIADAMVEADQSGTLGRATVARQSGVTPSTTIRLDPRDIEKARVQAARRGLRYQTYLKMLIHEALQREESAPGGR